MFRAQESATHGTVLADLDLPDSMRRTICRPWRPRPPLKGSWMVFARRPGAHRAARLFVTAVCTWLAAALPLFSCHAAAAPNKIVISYAILSEREGVLMVARDQGFFRRQGLDVELVYMPSAPVSLAARAHGDSQVNTGSVSGAILGAMAGGLDLVFVAGLVNKLTGVIVTGPTINSPA